MQKRKPNQVPASLKNINLGAILRSRGIYAAKQKNKEIKEAAIPIVKRMLERKKVKAVEPVKQPDYNSYTYEDAMTYYEKQIRIVDILEKKFENKVEQFVTKMIDGFLNNLEAEIAVNKSSKKVKGYFDNNTDDLLVQAQLDFTPLLIDQAVLAGHEAYALLRMSDIYVPTDLRKVIAENVAKFTQSMIDTDRETLVNIITHGIESGKSIPEIRTQIKSDFANYSKTQAERITRTEVLRASNQAALDAYKQSGVVEGKQWLTAGAIDECAKYEGQIETLDGSFYTKDNKFADGDPPLHPNCRCVLLPVLVGEKSFPVQNDNKQLYEKIQELESQIDKRTKEFKELKAERTDDAVYIKSLEKYLGVEDE